MAKILDRLCLLQGCSLRPPCGLWVPYFPDCFHNVLRGLSGGTLSVNVTKVSHFEKLLSIIQLAFKDLY